jgi:formamidopyrimidine-DNA glycosylase
MAPTLASGLVPELPEVEAYRRRAVDTLGRPIVGVEAPDPRFVRGSAGVRDVERALTGARFAAARRTGKLLVLDLDGVPVYGDDHGQDGAGPVPGRLGVRFGMTGRLAVDGAGPVERLLYAGNRDDVVWDRFIVHFADGGTMVVHDPRLLGGVELDPDESRLGPDALSLAPAQLRAALEGSAAPLKARLLDQARIAGIGNLIADEVLWRAKLAPARPAGSLDPPELRRLHRHLRTTLDELMARGGSHMGDLMPARRPGGRCPRDGAALMRSTVGGRTSWWCPRHQR